MRALFLIASTALALAGCQPAAPTPAAPALPDRVYISHQLGEISLLEPAHRTLTTLAGRLWQQPWEIPGVRDIAISRDGSTAFAPSSRQNAVFVVDLYAGKIEETIAVEGAPEELELTRDGRRLYVTTVKPHLAVIDIQAGEVDHLIELGSPAAGLEGAGTIEISRDGRWIGVLTQRADLVLIDTATDQVARSLPLGGAPVGLALSPDARRAWVAGFPENAVALVDLSSGRVLDAVAVGSRPLGLALTPDGRWLWVANSGGSSISVIDTAAATVVTTIAVAPMPTNLAVSSDGAFVLAVHTNESAITVLDAAKRSVAYRMYSDIVPQWPTSIAVP